MTAMTVVLDLDDVLANLRESLYRVMLNTTGIDYHWRHWPHYDLTQHYGIDKQTLHDILRRERALESCLPEPNAVETVQRLSESGFEIVIATARGWHPRAAELTRAWLDEHGVGHDHLHVVPLGGDKMDVLAGHADIVLAVDDHPRNIKRYQRANIPTLMVDMPWNAGFEEAERIYALDPVVERAVILLNNDNDNDNDNISRS